ncbi:hypothetical protein [Nonomuraea antimicrobica]|uniref:hypothetical protein n=1 Tax=Nonomuraea antimicrobica TaxID=561173 RepID=UPI0031E5E7FA
MGYWGLSRFNQAAPEFPDPGIPGVITIGFSEPPPSVEININFNVEDNTLSLNATMPQPGSCIDAFVHLIGSNGQFLDDDNYVVANGDRLARMSFCDKQSPIFSETIRILYSEPILETSGPVTSVNFPEMMLRDVGGTDMTVKWAIDPNRGGLKPEAVSEGYRGPGFRWEVRGTGGGSSDVTARPGVRILHPFSSAGGIFISVEVERAANRSLFYAGLLTGMAASFLVWALEMGLGLRRSSRSSDNPAADVTDEQIAGQIAQLLGQRMAAEQAQALQVERERRSGRWRVRALQRIRARHESPPHKD